MEKLWIYQADRKFTDDEATAIAQKLRKFTANWAAHGQALKAQAAVMHNLFILLQVDEARAKASGCSIDSSVALMREIESEYHVNLFDRQQVAYKQNDEVHTTTLQELPQLFSTGKLTENTLVFNNLIQTPNELERSWAVPLKESWHKRFLN
ncbi:MAG: ABC transporter ATPase [Bacteroidia bacterium]